MARVILDASVNSFNPKVRNFVEKQAKPALEKNFDENLKFYVSRQRIEGPVVYGPRGGFRRSHGLTSELTISASKRTFSGFIERVLNPIGESTHFEKIDESLFGTLASALKALTDPNRFKYTIEEVLRTATNAVNKLRKS